MEAAFRELYNRYPAWHVRAPGRVNIIGEHIDHQSYEVLPAAIEQCIDILSASPQYLASPLSQPELLDQNVTPESPTTAATISDVTPVLAAADAPLLEIHHVDSARHPSAVFKTVSDVRIDTAPKWIRYILAAYIGLMEFLAVDEISAEPSGKLNPAHLDKVQARWPGAVVKFKLLVNGNIPAAAGLSSSSALVVAAAKTFCLGAGGCEWTSALPLTELASVCAQCERLVGTAGGGMDQAAICLSTVGRARVISFNPLMSSPIPLPEELSLVVAHSGREAPKLTNCEKMYNKRVFELKAACLLMVSKVNKYRAALMPPEELMQLTVKQVVTEYLKLSETETLKRLPTLIEQRPYTKNDLEQIMNNDQRQYLLTHRCGQAVWDNNEEFFLFERTRHVLGEVLRVRRFVGLCLNYVRPSVKTPAHVLKELGHLVHESGVSLDRDYDCGCEELTQLCNLAESHGSLGTRLVGAGWGGCTVSLVLKDKVEEFKQALIKDYYQSAQIQECIFSTIPAQGLTVFKLYRNTK